MKHFALIAAGLLTAGAAFAQKIESGLKPGEAASAFQVVDVTGPNKPNQLCYV